jgi:internalin A
MLNAKDYPQEKWAFLLRLMSLFQLSFPLDEEGQRQLVPALLPVEEPSEVFEPEGEGRVRLRYEFNLVPAPLVPRLLVRAFGLIDKGLHWRRGALFRYGQATAKVWEAQDERGLYATISGAQKARDDLIRILKENLRALFAEYKNLNVVEQMEWGGEWVPRATLEKIGIIPVGEIAEVTTPKPSGEKKPEPVRIFVSYSHENLTWSKRLSFLIKAKANVNPLQPWHDTELKAGDRWDKEIRTELERMDIFLCLVSYQFLASDYIKTVELPRAMARHKNGEIEVVPVILYRMDLERDCKFLYELNPLPEWNKPWQDFIKDGDWNDALPLIGNGIEQAIEKALLRPLDGLNPAL